MIAKKFELWFGCLGNGVTVCNSAVMEHGDFKHIAHIQPYGKVKLYVEKDYIPTEDLKRIYDMAEKEKVSFLELWNKLPLIKRYEAMLDHLSINEFLEWTKENKKHETLEQKVEVLQNILKGRK